MLISSFSQIEIPYFSLEEIEEESERLFKSLIHLGWPLAACQKIAPWTLGINYLKKQRNLVILAHSYQTPDIVYGVADFKGDSYYLSKVAQNIKTDGILFAGVHFMAETAKILNPDKDVLISDINAGCSLSESITGKDIRALRQKYPGVPVVSYINTSAEVKAESDVIVTSANAPKILKRLGTNKVIFLPDKYMVQNLHNMLPEIEFITWHGTCIVHEEFTQENVHFYRDRFGSDLQILVHTECAPEVVSEADLAGGTGDMIRFIDTHPEFKKLMLVTECGLVDRMRVEFPDREFIGSCNLCPYMKKINLSNILETLRSPQPENVIEVPDIIRSKAVLAIEKMFELSA